MNAAAGRALALVAAGGALLAAAFGACSSGYEVDLERACRDRPDDARCAGGAGGAGGGMAGPRSGAGGAPAAGAGGGGGRAGAGGGPCASDAACAAGLGAGSLCVAAACTSAASTCDRAALVVVAAGRDPADAALAGACYFRTLDDARRALSDRAERLVLVADDASSSAPLALGPGVALEGRAADPAKPVALTLPVAAGQPLVSLGPGGSLRGVALDGGATATAVAIGPGVATVAGPLAVVNAAVALDVGDGADVTATGAAAAPVRFAGGTLGVRAAPDAKLTLRGDGQSDSFVIENTDGPGVLVLAGGSAAAVTIERVRLRANAAGVEVQQGRDVALLRNAFAQNTIGLTLNAEEAAIPTVFGNVRLEGNNFAPTLPEPGRGVAVCGSRLGLNNTTLKVGPGNLFPSGKACGQLVEQDSCNEGTDVGFDASGKKLKIDCVPSG